MASVEDLVSETRSYTGGNLRDLLWHILNDPYIELPYTKRATGKIKVQGVIRADSLKIHLPTLDRIADFLDYNFDLDVASTVYMPPDLRAERIKADMQSFFMPLQPFAQQQGVGYDIQYLAEEFGRLRGEPIYGNMLVTQNPREEFGPVGELPGKSPVTERTYNRVSTGPDSQAATEAAMVNASRESAAQQGVG
jgi:hypothetical protein